MPCSVAAPKQPVSRHVHCSWWGMTCAGRRLGILSAHLSAADRSTPCFSLVTTDVAEEAHAFRAAGEFAQSLVEGGRCHGLCLAVGRAGRVIYSTALGSSAPTPGEGGLEPNRPVEIGSIWEVASVTKPFTALAVVQLIERAGGLDGRGSFTLDTRVSSILPAFGGLPTGLPPADQGWDRSNVTLRHLMTHTSGLRDAIDIDRSGQPSLDEHLDAVCKRGSLQFAPGTDISYSSQGIMLLAGVVEAVTGTPLPAYLSANVFVPLGMLDTCLGAGGSRRRQPEREMTMHFQTVAENRSWDHNSTYWRNLGAPWGGLLTTVHDMTVFYQAMLGGASQLTRERILLPATEHLMCQSFTHRKQSAVPVEKQVGLIYGEKPSSSWGLGFRINEAELKFGVQSSRAFGHHGASGAIAWADPMTGLSMVCFSTEPSLCYSEEFNQLSALVVEGAASF